MSKLQWNINLYATTLVYGNAFENFWKITTICPCLQFEDSNHMPCTKIKLCAGLDHDKYLTPI